jgi:hypothetical protein
VTSSRQVSSQVNRHRPAIAGYQHKTIRLAPEQDVRVKRSALRGARIANDPDHEIGRLPDQLSTQFGINMLVEQVADRTH